MGILKNKTLKHLKQISSHISHFIFPKQILNKNEISSWDYCYCSADIFIFSSRSETRGLALLEAMAQGVPVVSTAELGTRDVLKEGQGVWIAKEELGDFSEKIILMPGNAEVRKELGEKGRDYAHGWSASKPNDC